MISVHLKLPLQLVSSSFLILVAEVTQDLQLHAPPEIGKEGVLYNTRTSPQTPIQRNVAPRVRTGWTQLGAYRAL